MQEPCLKTNSRCSVLNNFVKSYAKYLRDSEELGPTRQRQRAKQQTNHALVLAVHCLRLLVKCSVLILTSALCTFSTARIAWLRHAHYKALMSRPSGSPYQLRYTEIPSSSTTDHEHRRRLSRPQYGLSKLNTRAYRKSGHHRLCAQDLSTRFRDHVPRWTSAVIPSTQTAKSCASCADPLAMSGMYHPLLPHMGIRHLEEETGTETATTHPHSPRGYCSSKQHVQRPVPIMAGGCEDQSLSCASFALLVEEVSALMPYSCLRIL